MTSVKRVIRRSKKATKKLSKRRSKKRVTALKSKSKRHTRRNKSKHHGGVRERASAKNTKSKGVERVCRQSESKAAIISYINNLMREHEPRDVEVKRVVKERLSDKPMASIMRSLSGVSSAEIIGTHDGMGMSYDNIFNRFNRWRASEAERRAELRASKRAGVSPRAMSSSRSRKKDSSNDSDEAYSAAMTILSLQEEREIDKEIDDDALRDMQMCEDYTDPPPTITTIPSGFTPVKKKEVSVSSIEPIVNNPTPSALFGRPKKNDDDSDGDLDNFMNDIEGYDN
jgi:hypothetical protein